MSSTAIVVQYTERVGAVDRIVSLLRRRGFPIAGMTLERTHQAGVGRMTVAVSDAEAVEQVTRHLQRLPDVIHATACGPDDAIAREFALVRVRCTSQQRPEIDTILSAHQARAVSTTADAVVVEATGTAADMDALFAHLEPFGIEESARTHPTALGRTTS